MLQGEIEGPIRVDRPLSTEEYVLTRWILENGLPEGPGFIGQLDKARVCSLCSCGCRSFDLSIDGAPRKFGPLQILGEFWFGNEEDRTSAGVFVFAVDGLLAGLEVTAMYDEAPDVLPDPRELHPG